MFLRYPNGGGNLTGPKSGSLAVGSYWRFPGASWGKEQADDTDRISTLRLMKIVSGSGYLIELMTKEIG